VFDWDSHLKRSSGGEYPGFPSLRWILCRKLKRLYQHLCKGPMNGLQRKTARNNKMRSHILRKDCSRVAKTRAPGYLHAGVFLCSAPVDRFDWSQKRQ